MPAKTTTNLFPNGKDFNQISKKVYSDNMVLFILYVADQQKSMAFYKMLLDKDPVLHVPGMTEFALNDNCKLGLMPESGIAKILSGNTPQPSSGNGIPRCELYLYCENMIEAMKNAEEAGAKEVNPLQPRDWGDSVVYYADLDAHIIALARKKEAEESILELS